MNCNFELLPPLYSSSKEEVNAMRHQAIKVRLYPTTEQKQILAQHFGCSRFWWNYALNLC
ncbi:MAG: helix-turn-helix domain-containing protein, partial [Limnoraphis sp.]